MEELILLVEHDSTKPKYLQIADSIIAGIEVGNLTLQQRLPSVNKIATETNVSRETVFKALNYLSEKGIVNSVNRKGYYVQRIDLRTDLRIFLMLDKLTVFKEKLYNAFYENLKPHGEVDVFFHHHNYKIFKNLVEENINNYTHFVIVTFLKENVAPILNTIPRQKRIVLDCHEPSMNEGGIMIYQDFAKDIFTALQEATPLLQKYKRLLLIAPNPSYHADRVKPGFIDYCRQYRFPFAIIESINAEDFRQGDVYITITMNDRDEVEIIKLVRAKEWKLGKDIGIISYNDAPVKEVLEGGLTVISTDFELMGKQAAELILSKEEQVFSNPSRIIMRNSL
ncbi:MAG: GntR family transcriptional regulator [Bacteroidota bacterium]